MPIPLDPWDQSMRWQHGWKFFSPRLPSVNLEFLYLGQKRTMTNWVMVDGWPILADRFAISPPKPFLGSKTPGYQSGLRRLMKMCKTTGDFRKAFASLLAACYADPTLANGGQGPILLAAKAKVAPSVEAVREKAKGEAVPLTSAGLRVCDYDTGAVAGAYEHLETVPTSGCQARPQDAVGVDFMTGGLAGQATQDISASWFGGYLFDAGACGLGGGQDERLSVYFPEVTVLAYFLSESHPFPQVRQPLWILGARNFFKTLDGTARFDSPMELADVPLDNDLVEVPLAGANVKISSSRPFVVFMSESQGFFDETMPNLHLARTNRLPAQRDMGQGKASFEKQVRAWYRSLALTSYDEDVQPALKALVSSVGAGPWLAGLWWGDSQLGFLAVWLGQALAATTWGTLPLDYYVYSDFTENPGNQCYILPGAACQECLRRCADPDPPASAYWMPDNAYFNWRPCVPDASICGAKGISDIVAAYGSRTVWMNSLVLVRLSAFASRSFASF
ncbi:unnamed protein product [Durusdinium trenchii]|uniref:Poly(ADP-ribose) glycohydrolase n=1 Tax=Durusdinium trenchii TaxID=1381693 RepID=A0ABP0N553_9DINO